MQKTTLNAFNKVFKTVSVSKEINSILGFNDIATKSSQIDKMAKAVSGLGKQEALLAISSAKLNEEDTKRLLIKAGVITKEEAETVALKKNTLAKAANYAITHPLAMLIGATLVAAVAGLTYAIYQETHAEEIAAKKHKEFEEALQETKSTIKDIQSEFGNAKKSVFDIAQEFAELAQGVDSFTGKNRKLSTEQYERFLELGDQLLEIFPDLPHVYDENGRAIVSLNGNVDTIVGTLNDLVEVQRKLANQKIMEELPEAYENTVKDAEVYNGQISRATEKLEAYKNTLKSVKNSFADLNEEVSSDNVLKDNIFSIISSSQEEAMDEMKAYKALLDNLGVKYSFDTSRATGGLRQFTKEDGTIGFRQNIIIDKSDIEKAEDALNEQKDNLVNLYQQKIKDTQNDINQLEQKQKGSWSSLASMIVEGIQSNDDYSLLDDASKGYVQTIINGLDLGEIKDRLKEELNKNITYDDIQKYIEDNIIAPFNDPEISKKISSSISNAFDLKDKLDSGEIDVGDYVKQIEELITVLQNIDGIDPEIIKSIIIKIGYEDTLDEQARINSSIDSITGRTGRGGGFTEKTLEERKRLKEYTDQLTPAERELWLEVTQGIEGADKAIQEFERHQKEAANGGNEINILSVSETVDKLNEQIKPAMDSLKDTWQKIWTDDGFTLKDIDLSVFDSIKSKLDEMNDIDGITIDYSSFDEFVRVLNDTSSSEDAVREAFNKLATEISGGISGVEDFELLKQSLEEMGVVNNEIVAFDKLISNAGALSSTLAALGTNEDKLWDITENGVYVLNASGQAFVTEMVGAENAATAIELYEFKKNAANGITLTTAEDCQNLIALCGKLGITGEMLELVTRLMEIYQKMHDTTLQLSDNDRQSLAMEAEQLNQQIKGLAADASTVVDFNGIGGGKSAASSAGSEAGDAYVEAFEAELQDLQTLRDNGVIGEREYLDRLRALYQKYFADKKQYLYQYQKYEKEYLEGMKSLYEQAFSYITSQIDKRISSLQDEKEAATDAIDAQIKGIDEQIKAVNKERDAKLKAIEDEQKALKEQQKMLDKQIKAKQDEIDAIQDAADERDRELTLAKAMYEMERMKNQRTRLVKKIARIYSNVYIESNYIG